MEIRKCNICGQEESIKELFELPFYDLWGGESDRKYVQKLHFCDQCGFLFTANPFSEEQLSNRYKNFSKYEFDSEEYILEESDGYRKRCIRQFHFINNAVGDTFTSILEIGAASGYNLSLYSDKEVKGIEPSFRNCRLAQKYYHVDMYNGMFSEFIKEEIPGKYDLLFLSHVLEHIINPRDFILECKNVCDKYIFIEVPGMDYKFVEEPMGMFCEEHVNYFTLESLSNLMFSAGFELVDANYIFGLHENLPAGWPAVSTIWKLAEGFPKMRKKAVYDSDVRKNVYTFCGVNISAFDENDIYDNVIDCILVATYTAQKAISKVLDKYKDICTIYYLYDL